MKKKFRVFKEFIFDSVFIQSGDYEVFQVRNSYVLINTSHISRYKQWYVPLKYGELIHKNKYYITSRSNINV